MPSGARRGWAIGKHRFDRMMARTTPGELDGTNGSDLAIGKVCILSLQIDDELAHRNRQGSMMVLSLSLGGSKETDHAVGIKSIGSSSQATFRQTSFLGT